MSSAPGDAKGVSGRGRFIAWMVLLSLVFAGFIWLGNWQVRRLGWKLGLIHDVNTRVGAPPVAPPGPDEWAKIKAGGLQYLHVRLAGHFLGSKQTLVHGPSMKGYGYWVMTPLMTQRGFIVLVNRGYIPAELPQSDENANTAAPPGEVTLTGLLRLTEPGGGFLRPNKPKRNEWYSRDVDAIAKARGLRPSQVAPYFVDAQPRSGSGKWPVAGLTRIHFRNHHLGYAITWYVLALGTLIAAGIIVRYHCRLQSESSD